MNRAPETPAWPFPGVVWGDYPERPQGQARRNATRLSRRGVERFVDNAAAMPLLTVTEFPEGLDRLRLVAGNSDEWWLQAFGLARSALSAALGLTLHREQLVAARLLLDDRLVEMATGEGKTAAIALAAGVAALARTPVHVVTANDYLAQRDADLLRPFYGLLGLRVGCVTQALAAADRRIAYGRNVTYCTGKELAFDYLRDSIVRVADLSALEQRARGFGRGAQQPVLRGLCMAIIDEADTVLVDEARMPLVLARSEASGAEDFLGGAIAQARAMVEGIHFRRGDDRRRIELTPAGAQRLEQWPLASDPLHAHPIHRRTAVELALTALRVLQRDRDYVVRDGQVLLIDETTGRAAPGRAWSQGLHQMVELKEGVAATPGNSSVTQITFQRFFPRYFRLAGTSGTLAEARRELKLVYGLDVVTLAPRLPRRVTCLPDRHFSDSAALWRDVAARSAAMREAGRAVLVGTDSVAQSEALSAVLSAAGLQHRVLNARQDRHESELIAAAGQAGRITVATSMAGRGADILLEPEVLERGGLHVILCQLNPSPRIDRQFLGRAGRQGQPGSTETLLALDFALLERWLPQGWLGLLRFLGCPRLFTSATVRLAQSCESFTQRKQRVTLSRVSREGERELTFTRQGVA